MAVFTRQRASSPAASLGLRYERSVAKELKRLESHYAITVEHNPWFRFTDANGDGACAPDFVIRCEGVEIIMVVECKYTFVPEAVTKLRGLYVPVVSRALRCQVRPVVITKTLTGDVDARALLPYLADAFAHSPAVPVFQWLGKGALPWQCRGRD